MNDPPAERQAKPLGMLFGGLGFAVAFFGLRMFSVETRLRLYIGGGVGLLLALIPFAIARKRGQQRLAAISLVAGLLAGAVGGVLLAVPVVVILVVVIVRKRAPGPAV